MVSSYPVGEEMQKEIARTLGLLKHDTKTVKGTVKHLYVCFLFSFTSLLDSLSPA